MGKPNFWHADQGGLIKVLLTPASWLYDWASKIDRQTKAKNRYIPNIPVICVGNLVAGGQGKTPVVEDIINRIAARGIEVHALSRGYGGNLEGPVRVDPDRHETRQVGDEPMLLSRTAPVWVAKDRALGAKAAITHGAEVLVMDDGFQNPSIAKTCSVIVIDGGFGFGNGGIIPSGPLREPIATGFNRAQAAIIIGEDTFGTKKIIKELAPTVPILEARLTPIQGDEPQPPSMIIAFAGIGRPQKFFDTLKAMGYEIFKCFEFEDHQLYDHDELLPILDQADAVGASVFTTAKDMVRVPIDLRHAISVLEVTVAWQNEDMLTAIIDKALDDGRPHART